MQAIEQDIRAFVNDNFLFSDSGETLSDDESFLEKGIIDSTGVLELVTFLEERFQVRVADDELVPENLDSVTRLIEFIESKLQELGD